MSLEGPFSFDTIMFPFLYLYATYFKKLYWQSYIQYETKHFTGFESVSVLDFFSEPFQWQFPHFEFWHGISILF